MTNVQAVLFLLISCDAFNKGTNIPWGHFPSFVRAPFREEHHMGAATQLSDFNDRELVCRRNLCLFVVDIRSFQTNNCHQLPLWLGERVET